MNKGKVINVKKNDIKLIAIILVLAVAGMIFMFLTQKPGDKVIVIVDGEIYKEYSLNKDLSVDIEGVNGGINHLVIEEGHADVTDADCPDKLCVNQKQIDKNGETIVCLPNKVIVKVISETESEIDGVAN
ncbi:MAG: NusG domain II-containing protein [Anaerocolumna sp.]